MNRAIPLSIVCLMLGLSPVRAERRGLGVAGDFGFGGVGGRAVTTLQTGVDVEEGNLSLGLFGRVRFLLQDDDESGAVRRRDWDEPSDYVHILRYLQYRRAFATRAAGEVRIGFQAGEILGYTLGHGTLIRDYSNIADPDHPHAGIHIRVGGPRWQLNTLVDNLINPSVLAQRLALRPLERAPGLQVGASLVLDPRAPLQVVGSGDGYPRGVSQGFNLTTENRALTLVGLEAEYALGDRDRGRVVPYLDLNTSMLGVGLHLGSTGELPLARGRARLTGQLEWTVGSSGYAPTHMGTFYDVERYQSSLAFDDPQRATPEDRATKLSNLARGAYGGHGALGQVGFAHGRLAGIKLGVSYRPGPDAVSLWCRATSSPTPRLQLGMLLVARGVGQEQGTGSGLMAIAEGRFRITDALYSLAQYTRSWSLRAEDRYFGLLQSFNLSIGASWSG